MKILMLAPQPFFEPRGTPFSVLGRLRALSQLGHEVDLLTYHLGQDVSIPGVTIWRTPAVPGIKEIAVGPSLAKLGLDILLLGKAVRRLQKTRYDVLHTHEEACFFGMVLAKGFGVPHLYDMHSSLPQQLSNFRYSRLRPLIQLFERLERRAINTSAALITICPALEAYVKTINDQTPQVMIENVANEGDPASIADDDLQLLRMTHGFGEGQKIILYTGTFEPYQGLDLLMASAEHILAKRQDVLFVLVGGKPEQIQHYQTRVAACDLAAHFRFVGTRPPEEMPPFIGLADVLVSPRTDGTNTPLKIYSYLQSGKPIVATNLPTHTQVLTPDVAVLAAPQPLRFAQGILDVLAAPAFGQQLGRQARQLFEQHYSYASYVQKTDHILQLAVR